MPGMATKSQIEELRAASGREAEVLYLKLMTAHHRGGVHMAEGCVQKCAVAPSARSPRAWSTRRSPRCC